ncbi:MAG: sigma-70 family RNA polymerase sigma factor [Lentisphaeraceae bacterium]|nr:sigma-70 family RNA polymerase sigma factor [Lentisphaeraceae bacterium]
MSDWKTSQSLLLKLKSEQDDDAWEVFVNYYQPFIYVILRRMGLNHHDTEEISQKVILKIWQKLSTYYDSEIYGKFRNWVGKVTYNMALNFFKSRKRYDNKLLNFKDSTFLSVSEPELEKISEEEWQKYITSMAWDKLKGKCSEKSMTIFEQVMKGRTTEEIVKDLGVTTTTVYVYKKRVKEKLSLEISLLKDLLE